MFIRGFGLLLIALLPQAVFSSLAATNPSPTPPFANATFGNATNATCSGCFQKANVIQWDWPALSITTSVVATVFLKTNTKGNTTVTSTRYNNATATKLQGSDFGPGVTLINDTPIKTLEATIYTNPTSAITLTTVL